MKVTQKNLIEHPLLNKSIQMVWDIMDDFKGYICHDHVYVLYLIKELMADDCKTYLEIGTHNGGSLVTVMQSKYKTNYCCVDLWDNDDDRVKTIENVNKYNKHKHPYELVKGMSNSPEVLRKVNISCKNGVDLLFIDGGHDYNTVMADYYNYSKLVNKGGVIVFDDYLLVKPDDENKMIESFPDYVRERKIKVRLAVDDILKKHGEEYDIVGLIPNIAGAYRCNSGLPFRCYSNIEFIMVKK